MSDAYGNVKDERTQAVVVALQKRLIKSELNSPE